MAKSRLIFAVTGAEEKDGREAFRALRSYGLKFLEEVEVVEGKQKILQCLERFDDVAVVIASQSQMNVPMQPTDFDEISTAGASGDYCVVPILRNKERGTEYMASLCSLGLNLALYQKDAVLDQVAELVLHGRTKSEVREYYGISAEAVAGQADKVTKRAAMAKAAEEPKKAGKKKKSGGNKSKESKKTSLELGEYALISTNIGVGCTYQAIMMATAVKRSNKDLKVAVVELDNEEQNMKVLCMQALDRMNVHGITSFEIGGVSFFFDTKMDAFMKKIRPQFDIVIYDAGFCGDDSIYQLKQRVNRVFVVADVNEWHRGELNEFVRDMNTIDRDRQFVYLFPCMSPQVVMDAINCLDGSKGYAVGFEASAFDPSKKTASLLVSLLEATLPAVKYPNSLPIQKRMKSGGASGENGNLWKLTTLFFAILAVVIGLNGKLKYDLLYDDASASILLANQNIDTLNAAVQDYENEVESLNKTVLRLKEDVSAGEEINWSMVETATVKSEEEQELFLSIDDIEGKVFCVSLPADSLLYDYMLVEAIEEAPPVVVTIGGAVGE